MPLMAAGPRRARRRTSRRHFTSSTIGQVIHGTQAANSNLSDRLALRDRWFGRAAPVAAPGVFAASPSYSCFKIVLLYIEPSAARLPAVTLASLTNRTHARPAQRESRCKTRRQPRWKSRRDSPILCFRICAQHRYLPPSAAHTHTHPHAPHLRLPCAHAHGMGYSRTRTCRALRHRCVGRRNVVSMHDSARPRRIGMAGAMELDQGHAALWPERRVCLEPRVLGRHWRLLWQPVGWRPAVRRTALLHLA